MEPATPEFWENAFKEKKEMWGFDPCPSALAANELFVQHSAANILLPGFGYGRNAQVFLQNGISVTGIEISKTAIGLARKHYGDSILIDHGSVADMPFDDVQYDGIFSHALIHLLDETERHKFVMDCYQQLKPGGYMVFSLISKAAATYGTGKFVSRDRYELYGGVRIFFYDAKSVQEEFGKAGLVDFVPIQENFPFFLVTCKKPVGS